MVEQYFEIAGLVDGEAADPSEIDDRRTVNAAEDTLTPSPANSAIAKQRLREVLIIFVVQDAAVSK